MKPFVHRQLFPYDTDDYKDEPDASPTYVTELHPIDPEILEAHEKEGQSDDTVHFEIDVKQLNQEHSPINQTPQSDSKQNIVMPDVTNTSQTLETKNKNKGRKRHNTTGTGESPHPHSSSRVRNNIYNSTLSSVKT